MDLVIKITIGLFIFSILLRVFKLTKEYKQNNERSIYEQQMDQSQYSQSNVQSHSPMEHQEITKGDEDLVNNIIWEIENN